MNATSDVLKAAGVRAVVIAGLAIVVTYILFRINLGVPVRASSRTPESRQWPKEAEVVQADFAKPESMANALRGITKVFLYANPEGIDGFIKEAVEARIKHIVLLSSAAPANNDPKNLNSQRHLAVERVIAKSGIPYTFLRPGAFASNALYWTRQIREGGTVRIVYPLSQLAPIHEADIAAVATKALTDSGLKGATPWLTGPESITQAREVEAIAEAIGKEICLEELSPETALETMMRYMPAVCAEVVLTSLKRMNGLAASVSNEVEKITGTRARDFATWARDHREDFM